MKLAYPEIDTIFHFDEGVVLSAIIENQNLFYRFIDDLFRQSCGENGDSILSFDDTQLSIAGNLELLTDFFPFEINRKTLLNKVIARMEKSACDTEFFETSQNLLGQIEKLICDLAFQNDLELELPRLSISSLLKSAGICLKEDYLSLAEKILVYLDLMTAYGVASVFVFVNLRSFMDHKTLEYFTDTCCRKGYNILLIDNKEYDKISCEKRIVIDEELCEF